VRELPRQLTADELAGLFSGRTRLVARLAEHEDPLGVAREVVAGASEDEKAEALAAHPRIGERSPEQHGDDPCVLAELAALNAAYEHRFGFRFVVFVNGRSREEILPVLRERLQRTRAEELATGCDDLVSIALDRWQKGP
jgi:2-oxo-4-hydroxy-4-carboxy--5-ureidoimidazoline (OHCU) decarboxylase